MISRKAKLGGPVGSLGFLSGLMAKRMASLWRAVMASRFFTASSPKESTNLLANSYVENHLLNIDDSLLSEMGKLP